MKTRKFIAQIGNNNSVKVFDASNGTLYRVINVGGNIVSQPIVTESEMSVVVKSGNLSVMKTYNLPTGGLRNTVTLQ